MAHESKQAMAEREAEATASVKAEAGYARIVGRPLGGVMFFLGAGLALAAFGECDVLRATLWTCVGVWGLALLSIQRETEDS